MASDQLLTLLHTSRSISILHVSLPRRPRRTSNTGGTWISTFSPTASLHIINDRPSSDAILTVCFRDRILEEHYISKLHFSWPQVSCVSGYSARGSRTLFVSYRDSACKLEWPTDLLELLQRNDPWIWALGRRMPTGGA